MSDEPMPEEAAAEPSEVLLEALSREDGKNSTVRVFADRIEWVLQETISSLPRSKDRPPVIPLATVRSVKTKKDGPLFSQLLVRTEAGTVVFRMHTPKALEVRDALTELLVGGTIAPASPSAGGDAAPSAAPPEEPMSDDLRQLLWLRDEGMLSPEEFEVAKAQLRPS